MDWPDLDWLKLAKPLTTNHQHSAKMDWPKSAITVPKGGPKGSGPLSPRFWVWVCIVWGSGLNMGLWVFGGLGFLGSENLAKTH